MADSPYFDSSYFDGAYFDVDSAVPPEPPPGTSIRAAGGRLRPQPPQREDEDWTVLIL